MYIPDLCEPLWVFIGKHASAVLWPLSVKVKECRQLASSVLHSAPMASLHKKSMPTCFLNPTHFSSRKKTNCLHRLLFHDVPLLVVCYFQQTLGSLGGAQRYLGTSRYDQKFCPHRGLNRGPSAQPPAD